MCGLYILLLDCLDGDETLADSRRSGIPRQRDYLCSGTATNVKGCKMPAPTVGLSVDASTQRADVLQASMEETAGRSQAVMEVSRAMGI